MAGRRRGPTERQTDTARSVTFPFIRSSRRRLPGPDNEWMSKTQQLIQPRGEQRRKNTVGRRLSYSGEVLPRPGTLSPAKYRGGGKGDGEDSAGRGEGR